MAWKWALLIGRENLKLEDLEILTGQPKINQGRKTGAHGEKP